MAEKSGLNGMIESILDWAYEKALDGIPGLESAGELAEEYKKKGGTTEEQIDSLIKMQSLKCGASGFVTNIGGVFSFATGLAANLSSVIFLQLRMVAAIASLRGFNLQDERVKTMAMVCLCGKSANALVKGGIAAIGRRIFVREVPQEVLRKSRDKVATTLATKYGVSSSSKLIPIVSGLVGGAIDAAFTRGIGEIAKKAFEKGPNVTKGTGHKVSDEIKDAFTKGESEVIDVEFKDIK